MITESRLNKAIEIIQHAVKNGISIKSACVYFGVSDTYVKNVKIAVNQNKVKSSDKKRFLATLSTYDSKRFDGSSDNAVASAQKPAIGDVYSFTEKDDEAVLDYKSPTLFNKDIDGRVITLEDLLKKCNVDTNKWEVRDYKVNKWDVAMGRGKDEIAIVENYQVKANLVRRKVEFIPEEAAMLFRELIADYSPVFDDFTPANNEKPFGENLLEICLFDLHFGKLGWSGEINENYDSKIARKRFLTIIKRLTQQAEWSKFSQILFPIGNDFFNSDTHTNTTTAGTQQDEDSRWQKTFSDGSRLLIDAIEYLKKYNVPITVLVIPGNHDFQRSFYVGEVLNAYYNNDEQVNIDNGASPRKYCQFGTVLLGFTHGNEEKESSLPLLMATEQKLSWGNTQVHEWHLGHIHRKKSTTFSVIDNKDTFLREDLGVTIRHLSSLSGPEEWHHRKGFVGNIKAGEAFIWNADNGYVAHLNASYMEVE